MRRRTQLVLEALHAVIPDEGARLLELLDRIDAGQVRLQGMADGLQLLLDVVVPRLGRGIEGKFTGLVAHRDGSFERGLRVQRAEHGCGRVKGH